MIIKNLCLGCFEDYAEDWSDQSYCYVCALDHEDAVERSGIKYSSKRNNDPVDWYGPRWGMGTEPNSVSSDDLQHGFTALDEDGQPIELYFDASED